MHDASDGSQVGSCSLEPPRGNQDLSRGQDAHHNSMGLNVTFSMSFFFPRVLGQQEYEDEGGRQGGEAHP